MRKVFSLFIAVFLSLLLLTSCNIEELLGGIGQQKTQNENPETGEIVKTEENEPPLETDNVDEEVYIVTFETYGGTLIEQQKIVSGDKAIKPDNPVKIGYEFVDWVDENGDHWIFNGFSITKDITLYAKWDRLYYMITFNSNEGKMSNEENIILGYDDEFDLSDIEITRYGYKFEGWYYNDTKIVSGKYNFTTDIELVAKWSKENVMTDFMTMTEISKLLEEKDTDKQYLLEGVITAVNKTEGKTAFVITDSTGSIFCYDGLEVKLGQKVQVKGNYTAYNNAFHQLAKPILVKVLAENQDLAAVCGTPLVTTAQAINEAAKAEGATAVSLTEAYACKLLEVTGYVVNANGYANLAVAADVASCCNLYANANLNLKSFVGQKVVVKGFARGVSVGNGITIQVQSVELAEVEDMTTPPIVEENAIVVKTLKEALELVDGKKVIVTGRVKSIDSKWSIQYNYMSITITDGTADYYVYRMKNCVNINDLIEITGITSSSDGKKQLAAGSTSEIIGIYVDRTFLADIDVLDDGTHVIVRGFVKEINTEWSEQYGNISVTITDGISDLYVYRLKTNVKVGDELIIYGQVGSYNGDKQIAAGSYADILSK